MPFAYTIPQTDSTPVGICLSPHLHLSSPPPQPYQSTKTSWCPRYTVHRLRGHTRGCTENWLMYNLLSFQYESTEKNFSIRFGFRNWFYSIWMAIKNSRRVPVRYQSVFNFSEICYIDTCSDWRGFNTIWGNICIHSILGSLESYFTIRIWTILTVIIVVLRVFPPVEPLWFTSCTGTGFTCIQHILR